MDEGLKEIRRVLLGQTQRLEDGSIMALPAGSHGRGRSFQGVSTGWGAVHLLGITRRARRCTLQKAITLEKLTEILQSQGRLVRLQHTPEALACLCRHWMAEPVLITIQWDGVRFLITAYTARSLFAPLACRRVFRALGKKIPGTMEKQKREKKARRSNAPRKAPKKAPQKKQKKDTPKRASKSKKKK